MSFVLTIRVYAQDTDFGGVVHHSNYLRFMERARAEWAYHNGIVLHQIAHDGHYFVVRDAAIRYHRGATIGQELDVISHIKKMGKASVTYTQTICEHKDHEQLYASADITLAFVNESFKPQAIPTDLIKALQHEP